MVSGVDLDASELRVGGPALQPGHEGGLLARDVAARGAHRSASGDERARPRRARPARHAHEWALSSRSSATHTAISPAPMAAATSSAPSRTRWGAPDKQGPVLLARRFALHGVDHKQRMPVSDADRFPLACGRKSRSPTSSQPGCTHALDQAVGPGTVAAAGQRHRTVRGEMADDVGPAGVVPCGQDSRDTSGGVGRHRRVSCRHRSLLSAQPR